MDLELTSMNYDISKHSDVSYCNVKIIDIHEETLQENADKILPYINTKTLQKELQKRIDAGEITCSICDNHEDVLNDHIESFKAIRDLIFDIDHIASEHT